MSLYAVYIDLYTRRQYNEVIKNRGIGIRLPGFN